MDTILTQTPSSCGYTSFTYSVREDALGDMSGYGITVDNSASPPNLVINSSITAPKTYVMTWYATPAGATCLNSISFPFTIKIYCKLTDVTQATNLASSYDFYVGTAGTITYPTFK
jgi:hypothetical protein